MRKEERKTWSPSSHIVAWIWLSQPEIFRGEEVVRTDPDHPHSLFSLPFSSPEVVSTHHYKAWGTGGGAESRENIESGEEQVGSSAGLTQKSVMHEQELSEPLSPLQRKKRSQSQKKEKERNASHPLLPFDSFISFVALCYQTSLRLIRGINPRSGWEEEIPIPSVPHHLLSYRQVKTSAVLKVPSWITSSLPQEIHPSILEGRDVKGRDTNNNIRIEKQDKQQQQEEGEMHGNELCRRLFCLTLEVTSWWAG